MSKLFFRYSAMGAGKSLDLIKVAYNYEERGMKVVLFNSSLDTRYATGAIASRTGIEKKAIPFTNTTDFLELYKTDFHEKYISISCILVDEAQFLNKLQVEQLRKIVNLYQVPVICYGLRTDFKANLFEGSMWLLAWADNIEELKTICWCGRKATMNARLINGEVVKEGEQIQIGGNESYVALCQRHFSEGKCRT
ncbi:MAG: thymidine kinase [Deltaproteobacteria bacterium]|nr:thymidine kinase [Deltaproteobacteria bacterium]